MADDITGTPEGQVPAGEPTNPEPAPAQQSQAQPHTDPAPRPPREPATSDARNSDGQEPDEEPFDRDRALNTIRKLRGFEKTSESLRKELDGYKAREKEAEMAKLSEQERLQTLVAQREAELEHERRTARDRTNAYEVQIQATKLGIVDPDAAVKLLDWGALDYDDDGSPVDVAGALKQLVKDRPYLKAPEKPVPPAHTAVSPTNAATRQATASSRTYTQADISDYAFYQANRSDILLAMREGRIQG